ncbi:MAG: DsbA family protein [Alphaproteobacteria bacterium]|nr:DsbA family protein [Alphaproteobacteria bacterium]
MKSLLLALLLLAPLAALAAPVDPADQSRIEQAYQARIDADKAAAGDKLIARNTDALFHNPASGFLGNPNGDVTIVQFFDYDCGFTKRAEPRVEALLKADPGVKLITREFTIEPAESSPIAGRAALASIAQGKYAEYHQALLMAPEHPLPTPRVFEIAKSVGLDVERLKKDMEAPAIYAQIIANFNLARALRIFQTPTFIIGGHIVTEPSAQIDFPRLVAAARAKSP